MNNSNKGYNEALYTADSASFCKSCYSSSKGRAGCLVMLVAAIALGFLWLVVKKLTASGGISAAVVAAVAIAAVIIYRKIKNKPTE